MKKTTTPCTLIVMLLLMCSFANAQVQKTPTVFGRAVKSQNINPSTGHIRCATTEYEEFLQANDDKRMTDAEFEAWLAPLLDQYRSLQTSGSFDGTIITIPVVVHVIHNGEAVGTAPNITDAQVMSQIAVMNNDFRRLAGTPGFNTNAVGTDTQIQFALAQQDPNGNPTNGINRVNLCQASWSTTAINSTVKPTTQWDPTLYMNMWSVNFSDSSLLGYAQFPNASGLPGLNFSGGAANTDGVVANYSTFGSMDYNDGTFMLNAPYDRGRTMTHEVGHYLGLRHIWGDGNCSASDYCADTPAAADSNFECPIGIDSCPAAGLDMIENYMDYTDDPCMNLFTINQKDRMMVIMNNAARRTTLKTSTKDLPMTLFANDAEVKVEGSCSGSAAFAATCAPVVPAQKVTIFNRGTANLTTATISYSVNGGPASTYTWTGNLQTHKSATVDIPMGTASPGPITMTVTSANGGADQRATNNTSSGTFSAPPAVPNFASNAVVFRLQKDNYGSETTWTLKNSAGTTLYSGGPYTNQNGGGALITQNWTLPSNDCYVFKINDSYGDGMCCDFGNGFYDIKSADGVTTMISGGSFAATESKAFSINQLSAAEFEASSSIFVYPNPVADVLTIAVGGEFGLPGKYSITNMLGQTISQKVITSTDDLNVNTSSFSSGVYFITVTKDGANKTLRFLKK